MKKKVRKSWRIISPQEQKLRMKEDCYYWDRVLFRAMSFSNMTILLMDSPFRFVSCTTADRILFLSKIGEEWKDLMDNSETDISLSAQGLLRKLQRFR